MFYKLSVFLKSFGFKGNHLWWSLFFSKVAGLQLEIFQNTFSTEHLLEPAGINAIIGWQILLWKNVP